MRREVVLTEDAERDCEEIYTHINKFDSAQSADHVLDRLLGIAETLATMPERGAVPVELRAVGIQEYRQVFFKPYRVIYRVHDDRVVIYLIADGRRDMQSVLSRRLLGGRSP
ncbi:MAG: type II toxin-antitoxin system RelE/ParE family toxin [Steroidobacteraceae bacterium]